MGRMISVPRAALENLLRQAGSPLSPEEFVAEQPEARVAERYAGRMRAAAWSKYILALVLFFGVVITLVSFDLENVVVLILLVVVTGFEFRVHRYFVEGDPRAPRLGFVNQACFAAGIAIYGLAHAILTASSQIPEEYRSMMPPDTAGMVVSLTRWSYLLVAVVGGLSQYALALYYRRAAAP
jgi:hypothetical protein